MVHSVINQRLREVARRRTTTTYREVGLLAALDMANPAHRNEISRILDEINLEEHQEGRPLLSAVVVLADQNIPGTGFFEFARSLGLYSGDDDLMYWVDELRRVHDYWTRA